MKSARKLLGLVLILSLMIGCFAALGVSAYADECKHELSDYFSAERPTCTTAGCYAVKKCKKCGTFFKFVDGELFAIEGNPGKKADWRAGEGNIPAGHTLTDVADRAATCTEDGFMACKQCSVCSKYFTAEGMEIGDYDAWQLGEGKLPKGHTLTEVPGQAATCQADGWADYYHCTGTCGQFFADAAGEERIGDEVALEAWKKGEGKLPKGDAYEYHSCTTIQEHVDASCSKDGVRRIRECGDCRKRFIEKLDGSGYEPLAYTLSGSETWATASAARIPAEHNFEEVPGVYPNCVEEGYFPSLYCKDCKKYFLDKESPKLIGDGSYESWFQWACTSTQYGGGKLNPLGHIWSRWYVLDYPTKTYDGLMERHCERDGCIEQQFRSVRYDCCPQTGDESHIALWATMCALSVIVLGSAAVLAVRRKKNGTF